MQILAIETTGQFCSIALFGADGQVREKISYEKLNHLKTLVAMIEEILAEVGITAGELDAIAVSEGPGSFTGIRIGISTARALSQVNGTPCIAVPTLYSFAKRYDSGNDSRNDSEDFVCPIFDARSNQVFATLCKDGETIIEAGAYDIGELAKKITTEIVRENTPYNKNTLDNTETSKGAMPKLVFVGDGVDKYEQAITEALAEAIKITGGDMSKPANIDTSDISFEADTYQKAADVLSVAVEMYKKGETVTFEDLHPKYMRKSEAQRNLEERLKREL